MIKGKWAGVGLLAMGLLGGCADPPRVIDSVPRWLDRATESTGAVEDKTERFHLLVRIAIEWMEEGDLPRARAIVARLAAARRAEATQYLAVAQAQVGDYAEAQATAELPEMAPVRDAIYAVIVAALIRDREFEEAGRLAAVVRDPDLQSAAWSQLAVGQAMSGKLTEAKRTAGKIALARDRSDAVEVLAAVETACAGVHMATPALFIQPDDLMTKFLIPTEFRIPYVVRPELSGVSELTALSRVFLYSRLARYYARAGLMHLHRRHFRRAVEAAGGVAAAPTGQAERVAGAGRFKAAARTAEYRKAGAVLLITESRLAVGDRLAAVNHLKWTTDLEPSGAAAQPVASFDSEGAVCAYADTVGLLAPRSRPLVDPELSRLPPDVRKFALAKMPAASRQWHGWTIERLEQSLRDVKHDPRETAWLYLRLVENAKFEAEPGPGAIPLRYYPKRLRHPRPVTVRAETAPPGSRISYVVGYEQLDNWTGIETDENTEEGDFMVGRYVGRSPVEFTVIDRGYSYVNFTVHTAKGQKFSLRFRRLPAKFHMDTE